MKDKKTHKNDSGFKTPENYFESFNHRLLEKIALSEKQKTSTLKKMDSGFKVADDYFISAHDTILQKTIAPKPKSKLRNLISTKNIIYVSGVAAMIALILSISITKKSPLDFDTIEMTAIYEYLNEENIELSTTDIAGLLDEDINYIQTFEDELGNHDNLLDYLSEEDLENEIIFTE
ncbi:hypothetical protein AWE51_13585 [Aquimarina aggregata]|uniref:Uncharacterized protein n=1 Tax=Aquimarina aggregata TaxID=1642818 RepID=A0A162XGP1_9FLAO|nr:hypothetical protein [Aquimarina aggregata]KZS38625.1 hypothetical protein AWE51_13585 [Aquimarina aggregata]